MTRNHNARPIVPAYWLPMRDDLTFAELEVGAELSGIEELHFTIAGEEFTMTDDKPGHITHFPTETVGLEIPQIDEAPRPLKTTPHWAHVPPDMTLGDYACMRLDTQGKTVCDHCGADLPDHRWYSRGGSVCCSVGCRDAQERGDTHPPPEGG